MEDNKIKEIKDTMCRVGKYAYDGVRNHRRSHRFGLAFG